MILLVLVFIVWAINLFRYPIRVLAGKLKRLFRVWTGKQIPNIFEHHYLDGRLFYMYRFKMVPCIKFVNEMDISQAFRFMEDNCRELTLDIFQSSYLNREQNKQEFSKTVFVLRNKLVVELAGEYARIYHPNNRYGEADEIVKAFTAYKTPEKEKEFEINIITMSRDGLELKRLDIKPTVLDIDLYYNDDFKEVDELIRKRLGQQNDKGIVLLHGLPGTGKTTYLRHLVGSLDKRVLFVSPSVAGNLMNPEFIDLLIDNPNSVLIIEDAEDIIMDRKQSRNSSVSNLLNISDGLLSDCLSVQIICTFNSAISLVDSALMRKGRLIARYEFTKLGVDKAQRLSKHLGFAAEITKSMTIAEIANPNDKEETIRQNEPIGFRVGETMMN